jgi:hypothetical protein
MPAASPAYCRKTPVSRMGFTQRSSCRAQGIIARADGTKRKSKKYMQRAGLYDNSKVPGKKPYGYGSPSRARDTIRYLKNKPLGYKLRLATSMYNRAKYHANQTEDMRKSMKILEKYIRGLRQSS